MNDLAIYVRLKLEGIRDKWKLQRLLHFSLCGQVPADLDIVRLTLERGANPNEPMMKQGKFTVWADFLNSIVPSWHENWPKPLLYDCLRLFLDHRAERSRKIKTGDDIISREIFAFDIIHDILPPQLAAQLISLYPATPPKHKFKWLRRR